MSVFITIVVAVMLLLAPALAQTEPAPGQKKDLRGTNVPITNQNTGRLQNDSGPAEAQAAAKVEGAPAAKAESKAAQERGPRDSR